MPIRIASLLTAALLLTACTSGETSAPAPGRTGAPPVVVPASTSPPDAGTDCGVFILGQGEGLPRDAAECFIDAVAAKTPARLLLTRPTVEGDPIPITYAAGADGTVAVTTDTTQDKFGTPEIRREICVDPRRAAAAIAFGSCIPST